MKRYFFNWEFKIKTNSPITSCSAMEQITSDMHYHHERLYQRRQLDDFFAARSRKEKLLDSMPRLVLSECDPRARVRGVYVLSSGRQRESVSGMCHGRGGGVLNG
jgi:hypothetical protein